MRHNNTLERPVLAEAFEGNELHRIQDFMNDIAYIEDVIPNTIKLDLEKDDDPAYDAIRRFETYEQRAKPTFFVTEALQPYLTESNNTVSFAPRASRGGKRSYHGVFFGDIEIGASVVVPVAVKPHKDNSVASCLGDYLKNEAARELGFHTPAGVGYIMAGDRAYSMTILDETLTTFDSIDWSRFLPDITQHPGMQEMWREISQQVAILHAAGNRSHGDLAARNLATSAEGGVFMIDWEKARLDTRAPRDAETSFSHSFVDLSLLLNSMCHPPHDRHQPGIGIFYGKDVDWWQAFKDIFFDEYCAVRMIEVDHRLETDRRKGRKYHEAEVQDELNKLSADLRLIIKMEQEICEQA